MYVNRTGTREGAYLSGGHPVVGLSRSSQQRSLRSTSGPTIGPTINDQRPMANDQQADCYYCVLCTVYCVPCTTTAVLVCLNIILTGLVIWSPMSSAMACLCIGSSVSCTRSFRTSSIRPPAVVIARVLFIMLMRLRVRVRNYYNSSKSVAAVMVSTSSAWFWLIGQNW